VEQGVLESQFLGSLQVLFANLVTKWAQVRLLLSTHS
jgi:hypothetical protein